MKYQLFTGDKSLEIAQLPSPWNRVDEIAKRVGVEPENGISDGIVVKTDDDNYYNLFDVISGVLDYIDEKCKT